MLFRSKRLRQENLASRIVVQVHDELLVETKLDEVEKVKEILKEEMSKAATMKVKLEIGIEQGKDWLEAH